MGSVVAVTAQSQTQHCAQRAGFPRHGFTLEVKTPPSIPCRRAQSAAKAVLTPHWGSQS